MKITVLLDTRGAAAAGVDHDALVSDIQAELDKLTASAGAGAIKPVHQPPPKGAQGDVSAIQWLIDIATDPAMAKAYAQALIYAINTILQAAKSKQAPQEQKRPKDEKSTTPVSEDKSV